jgi:pimeloyl-ACP methyl ester carboxylesterase
MPFLQREDASIYYEEFGSGYPLLLLAPGSLQSTIDAWHQSPWDPTVELAEGYRVIAMDQRNAGRSRAPISAADGWDTYRQDQIAVLDQLGVRRAHVMGGCIGVPFAFGLIEAQPWRVSAAVMQNPSGAIEPRRVTGGFDRWREQLSGHPEATAEVLDAFHENLYRRLFVYTVTRDFVRACPTPMLILAGNDEAHPYQLSQELAELAPNAEFIAEWREGAAREAAFTRVREFLRSHSPVASAG